MRGKYSGVEFEIVQELNGCYSWIVDGESKGTIITDDLWRYTKCDEIDYIICGADE